MLFHFNSLSPHPFHYGRGRRVESESIEVNLRKLRNSFNSTNYYNKFSCV